MSRISFQEMANAVENARYFPNIMEVNPYVYKEDDIVNTIVFEFNSSILTLFDNGTYIVEKSHIK